jgi:hypothetical protein
MSSALFWYNLRRTLVLVVGEARAPQAFVTLRRRILRIRLFFQVIQQVRIPLELAFALSTLLTLLCPDIQRLR